jgi:hypothetical protein
METVFVSVKLFIALIVYISQQEAEALYDQQENKEGTAVETHKMASSTIMTEILQSAENFTYDTDMCGNKNTFHWPDYAILAIMLIVSASIGLFYGCFGPKQKTASDFLLGGSSMATFPMAVSLASRLVTCNIFSFPFHKCSVLLLSSSY